MSFRAKMDAELVKINDNITEMAEMVRRDMLSAVESVCDKNVDLAKRIVDSGDVIDDFEDEINKRCFSFLATQGPLATDLRYCVSVMKMIRDLERMGDHCEDLAKYTIRLKDKDYEDDRTLVDIKRMATMTSNMVNNAIVAFLDRDLRLARKVWKADEEVDEIYKSVYEDQMRRAEMGVHPGICISFAFIAAHLERVADYATNICEETVFLLEGKYSME